MEPDSGAEAVENRLPSVRFFDQQSDVKETKNRLPHWQQDGATYFVTFRLADSLPQGLLDQWSEDRAKWLTLHPQPWTPEVEAEYFKRFPAQMEQWLDHAHGECLLRRPECAEIVSGALGHFEGERCRQIAWVVMPNHVHVLVTLLDPFLLEQLVHSWKRFTAHQLNRFLGRSGPMWQRDYFDTIIRNEMHLFRCIRYIRSNPTKAQLHLGEYVLFESPLAKAVPLRGGAL